MSKPPIIAIEGMDASGKATHTKRLAKKLNGVVIDFPHYSTPVGNLILRHLKGDWQATKTAYGDPQKDDGDAMVFQSLMTINRFELMPEIEKNLKAGIPLVFDRYWASAVVYGGLDGLDIAWIKKIQAPLPSPTAWVFLDISPEESVRRRPERRDRYERQAGLMEKVRSKYLELFKEENTKSLFNNDPPWHIIDGMGTVDEVHDRICKAVNL